MPCCSRRAASWQRRPAYAIWTGIWAVGTAIVGIVFFQEPRDAIRLLSIAAIIAGIAGLKVTAPS